jgi:hypothetical protein
MFMPQTRQTRSWHSMALCWSPEQGVDIPVLLLQLYAFSYSEKYRYRTGSGTGEKVDSGELDINIVNLNDEFRRMK